MRLSCRALLETSMLTGEAHPRSPTSHCKIQTYRPIVKFKRVGHQVVSANVSTCHLYKQATRSFCNFHPETQPCPTFLRSSRPSSTPSENLPSRFFRTRDPSSLCCSYVDAFSSASETGSWQQEEGLEGRQNKHGKCLNFLWGRERYRRKQ